MAGAAPGAGGSATATPSPGRTWEDESREAWYFDDARLKASPSAQDGINWDVERTYKHEAFEFLSHMKTELKLGENVLDTAMVYLHRFYVYQSFKQFRWLPMAHCCLFLALKIEEKVMKMESLLKWSHYVKNKMRKRPSQKLDVNGREFWEMKEQLQFNERIVLQTIGFDLTVIHPAALMLKYIKVLANCKLLVAETKKFSKFVWTWCHFTYSGDFCIRFPPTLLACALMWGGARQLKCEIQHPKEGTWWDFVVKKVSGGAETLQAVEDDLKEAMVAFYEHSVRWKEPRNEELRPTNPLEDGKDTKLAVPPPAAAPCAGAAAPQPQPQPEAMAGVTPAAATKRKAQAVESLATATASAVEEKRPRTAPEEPAPSTTTAQAPDGAKP